MRIETNRFGTVEASDDEVIRFRAGIIGFPDEKEYVLIPHGTSETIAWLQSATSPELAFPVVSAHGFAQGYPDVEIEPFAKAASVGDDLDEVALLVVLSAPRKQPATVNLLAPIIINSRTREGAQIFLEGSRFSTRELFMVPPVDDSEAEGQQPEARAV